MSLTGSSRPVAIDPPGCGCTECLTGEYVPLERATHAQILKLFAGRLRDNTGDTYFEVVVHVNDGDYTWAFEATELIEAIRGGER
jgi:hypothetical protein